LLGSPKVQQILKDIYLDAPSSILSAADFEGFVDVNGIAYFAANDGMNGNELWRSDGTEAGTYMVKDIRPGSDTSSGNLLPSNSHPRDLINVNGTLFFSADDGGATGRELWKSNGTAETTVPVKDIFPGSGWSITSSSMAAIGDILYFNADDGENGVELWRSNGTVEGTYMVKDIFPGDYSYDGEILPNSGNPERMINLNGTLYFIASNEDGSELWKSNGEEAGTAQVADIGLGPGWPSPNWLTAFNDELYFVANDGSGDGLWKTDGTTTQEVLGDIYGIDRSANPSWLTVVNDELYFVADRSAEVGYYGLWKTTGAQAGTEVVAELNRANGSSSPHDLVASGNTLFFVYNNGVNGHQLWKSESESGTILVNNVLTSVGQLTNVDGALFFTADDPINGNALWKSDAEAGAVLVTDIGPSVHSLTNVGGRLFFSANDGVRGAEPWILVAEPIPFAIVPETINDDLQSVVSDVQAAPSGSGAAPPEVLMSVFPEELDAVIAAVESLAPTTNTPVVTIVVTLTDGDYEGQTINVPAGVRLVIDGTSSTVTFVGASPAFTVASGEVIVKGATFVNSTDAPTILVTGGSLVLRDSFVQETTGGSRAAIEITGGTVDLGSVELPGGNTFDVSGPGELIRNLSASGVNAIGNVFQAGGVTLTDSFAIEDAIFHGLDAPGLGVVNFGGVSLFVGPGGILQSAIDAAPPNATIFVAPGVTGDFDAGAKLLSINFENGPTVSQLADESNPNLRTLTVIGTPDDDVISFNSGSASGVIQAAISGVPTGSFMPTGRLIAYGEDGNDQMSIDESIALTAILDGGEGNDDLSGGAGDDLLLGGTGSDWLSGAAGNDFLAGGQGADRIVGSAGHDVLVAGEVASHLTHNDLLLIAQQWAANRTADNSTSEDEVDEVFDGFDILTGSSGADWFIVSLNDKVTDFKKQNKEGDLLTTV
jgi:ELWxxDGT repeat protein